MIDPPSDPSTCDSAAFPPGASVPCVVRCPNMEIEINDTPATNDDVVQIKSDHPAHRFVVNCRIRPMISKAETYTVVLTNPDGRLRFPGPADRTRTLSVPANGSWTSFQVSGESGSRAIGDAVIEAHCNFSTGPVTATKGMTVFWFDEARIIITTPGSYDFVGGNFTSTGGPAARYAASARIRPAGLDCFVPQIMNLKVGIMQESSHFQATITYGNPVPDWAPGMPFGIRLPVPTTITETTEYAATVVQPVADADANSAPLYDRPGIPTMIDSHSLQKLIGCQSGGGSAGATSSDTPSHPAPASLVKHYASGATPVVTVRYSRTNATRREHFRTFCVVFSESTTVYSALRQATWDLNVDRSNPAPRRAVASADGPATANPATGPNANDVPQPTVTTESGSTIFVHP
jgi:hypothetical protein